MILQVIQPAFPMLSVFFYPAGHFPEWIQFRLTVPFPAMLFDDDKAAFGQDLYMQGDRLPAHLEFFRYCIEVQRLLCHHTYDLSSCRVGYGLEYISSGCHKRQVFACKNMRKYLLAKVFFGISAERF